MLLPPEMRALPIKIMGVEWVMEYMLHYKKPRVKQNQIFTSKARKNVLR